MAGVDPGPGPGGVEAPTPPRGEEAPVWPYVVPLGGFLALTALEGSLPTAPGGAPSPLWYPLVYAAKLVAVSALLWVCRGIFRDLRPRPSPAGLALAVGLGLLVTAAWVGLDGRYPAIPFLQGRRSEFDPTVLPPVARVAFITVRMLGLVVVVPLIEELFYRSFLMRWVVDPDISRVPIGRVTPAGLAVSSVVFALSHPEWLPALLTGLAWGWLVGRTRSVSACVLSHATANLALGVYVLANHAWRFW
jgi:CAAX prenyl protease-like protein